MFNTKFFLKISPVCQDGASGAVGAGRHRHRRFHHHHQHPPRDAGAWRRGDRHSHVHAHLRLTEAGALYVEMCQVKINKYKHELQSFSQSRSPPTEGMQEYCNRNFKWISQTESLHESKWLDLSSHVILILVSPPPKRLAWRM